MLVETGLFFAIACILALAAFAIKAVFDLQNKTAFKALNLLAALLFSIAFFLEGFTIALAVALVWAIASMVSLFVGGERREQLRGWNEELWPRQHKKLAKKKRKLQGKKAEKPEEEGGAKIWPWS